MKFQQYLIEGEYENIDGLLFPYWMKDTDYIKEKLIDKIKTVLGALPPKIRDVIEKDVVWAPFGKKVDLNSGLWFSAWYSPKDKELCFPRGWLHNLSDKKYKWILIHELAHVYHNKNSKILKDFKPISQEATYMKQIHKMNKAQLIGELFADSIAEFVVNPTDLKTNAPAIYDFMIKNFS
jgi:hypothetical protein